MEHINITKQQIRSETYKIKLTQLKVYVTTKDQSSKVIITN